MADLNIPGISNKYKTNEYIDAMMQKERVPITREQETLDRYKEQQSAWRGVNSKMSALRESTKALYSFENPFNNKLASSSDERAITATAGREAAYEDIKIDVLKPASADRFLSAELEKDATVPQGTYTFEVAEKKISFNWKGGKISDFVNALNRRGAKTIKASMVGVSNDKKSLLIESLKTGAESNLVFRDAALSYAISSGLVERTKAEITEFGTDIGEFTNPPAEENLPEVEQDGMPEMTTEKLTLEDKIITLPPRSGFSIPVDASLLENEGERLEFSFATEEVEDITEALNIARTTRPELGEPGKVKYDEITILNNPSETTLPPIPPEPLVPITGAADFYVHNKDGSETKIETAKLSVDATTGQKKVSFALKEYPDIDSIVVRNRNTGEQVSITSFSAYDEKKNLGYSPVHPVSQASDAQIKYAGITVTRPTNEIDDIIPHVTLHVHDVTEKTATIKIEPDKESAKDALIQFVGNYNQVVAEMNILSQTKPEIVSELDYLSKDEQEDAMERLGMFQGDFSLTSSKASMQSIVAGNYRWSEDAPITMLSQIGISTRASGAGSSFSASQLRGYLEIDEKTLDEHLESDLDYIKNIFGFDTDGDLIMDTGIGVLLDKQLLSWTSTGGILANKDRALATRIKNSEDTIRKLESQLDGKEMNLKNKYGQMEGTLNSLQSQSNTINNWANSGRQQ